MNESESKSTILYESIIKTFKDDNTPTEKTVREINYYIGNRIFRKNLRQKIKNPKILIEITEQLSDLTIATGKYLLIITVAVNDDMTYALTVLDNIAARVEFLLNKKPKSLNLVYPSKNLRCRLINKASAIVNGDALKKIHQKNILFDITCDDEILEC